MHTREKQARTSLGAVVSEAPSPSASAGSTNTHSAQDTARAAQATAMARVLAMAWELQVVARHDARCVRTSTRI